MNAIPSIVIGSGYLPLLIIVVLMAIGAFTVADFIVSVRRYMDGRRRRWITRREARMLKDFRVDQFWERKIREQAERTRAAKEKP